MTIGIDASRSVSTIQKTGVEKVSNELLTQFIEVKSQKSKVKNNDFDFIFYTPKQIDWLPKENQKILPWPFKFFWTQIRLAFQLIFHPPEIMFFPVHSLPLILLLFLPFTNYRLPVASYYRIIHDIAFKKRPELYSLKQRLILNLDLWLSLKLCTKVFVPTEAVRQDIFTYSHSVLDTESRNKIIVTPWGYESINNNQSTINNKKKQILYIGRVEEKKNINNLIKAFEIFHKKNPDYKLILAGKMGDWIPDRVENDSSGVEFLGFVSEEKKQKLLRESAALVLVSQEEGFGFPILEAFDFDLPVIASDIPVLREVGGEACLYVNPNSLESMARGLENIISNEKIQSQLIAQGHKQLNNFTWSKTAEKILAEINKLC